MSRSEGTDPSSPRVEPAREEEAQSSKKSGQLLIGSGIGTEQRLAAAKNINHLFEEPEGVDNKEKRSLDRPKTINDMGETEAKSTAISIKEVFAD